MSVTARYFGAAACAAALVAAPAYAAKPAPASIDCSLSQVSGATACLGFADWTNQPTFEAEIAGTLSTWGVGNNLYLGKIEGGSSSLGSYTQTNGTGTISFSETLSGPLVVGLKTGGQGGGYYALYLVDGGSGINSVSFSYPFDQPTITGLSHVSVWANPVPEPETYAMMLAGLGVLGFIARRRRQQL
jgi:hypothetical protein